MTLQEPAFAKLNLSLDITGRRADGYHLLSMVNISVSLHDTLTLTRSPGGLRVHCRQQGLPGAPAVPEGPENLAYRAAEAFFRLTGETDRNVCISIQKRIPSEAGMGGGSSDAAAALRGLCRLYGCLLSPEQLCAAAEKIGADVPYCVQGGTKLVEGIGEEINLLPPLPPCWIAVGKPAVGVSTALAYRRADERGTQSCFYTPRVTEALQRADLAAVGASLGNGFEELVSLSEIGVLKDALLHAGALGACMTGSGSAVFGIFADRDSAAAAQVSLQQLCPYAFLCTPQAEENLL
ncbi:MAG: 4-(cytidine 5'-diphospho)-2-C-methyl-D-erythritol kinase [Oscillospiraceae bacterium]|jgi:4-diphosphocytidyl-2-C-methyl-D-erythritol kinase|nr:4-(cytidine 5'-diphospho)-2-C-methyl-D-erythritol kinase [Oscillospiraceae bacterium]MDD3262100.1 4-(cytidine 5'-diphospho)-2-C-methyl-D-erythritol kinase [Oscillospiraceae bacterium]